MLNEIVVILTISSLKFMSNGRLGIDFICIFVLSIINREDTDSADVKFNRVSHKWSFLFIFREISWLALKWHPVPSGTCGKKVNGSRWARWPSIEWFPPKSQNSSIVFITTSFTGRSCVLVIRQIASLRLRQSSFFSMLKVLFGNNAPANAPGENV